MKLIDPKTDLTNMDCHVHSPFSPDAKRRGAKSPQEIAEEVRRKNLRGFIITDHIDYGHWDGYIINFDEYFSVWENVRKHNPDLVIYIGLEVGFEQSTQADTFNLIKDLPLEYVINSVHYWHDGSAGITDIAAARKTSYGDYLKAISASLDAVYPFSTIGHMGYAERFAHYPDHLQAMDYATFKPVMDEIIQKAVRRNIRFEQNTNCGGIMNQPREDFLRAYKAAGGVMPVTGSDAHLTTEVGRYFDAAREYLDRIFKPNV